MQAFLNFATKIAQSTLQVLYCALLLLLLIPFASVDSIPRFSGAIATSIVVSIALLINGEPRATRHLFRVTVLIMILVVAAALLQTVALPWAWIHADIWARVSGLGIGNQSTISVSPADTLASIVPLALPFLIFLGGLAVFSDDEEAEKLIFFLAISGGLVAIYSVLQYVIKPDWALFSKKLYYLDSLTGVFINRNTAATYLGVVSILIFSVIWKNYGKWKKRQIAGRDPRQIAPKIVGLFALLGFSVVGLLLTKSRGGLACTLIAYAAMAVMITAERTIGKGRLTDDVERHWRSQKRLAQLSLVFAVIFGVVLLFGGRVILRAETQGIEDGRFCVWPSVIQAIQDHWLLGTGFGTFQETYPAYRDPHCGTRFIWDRAHNGFMEGWLGLGVLFPLLVTIAVVVLVRGYRRGVRERKSRRIFAVAGYAILILILAHALVDFSLQIPGFSTFAAAALSATVTISLGRQILERRADLNESKNSPGESGEFFVERRRL